MSCTGVLVVEDDEDIRESLREFFEEEGYVVAVASNGREGLNRVQERRPCVVVLDIIMPVMNGVEFYEALQANSAWADIPVVITTSDPSNAPSGVLIIKKPLNLKRLLDTVKRHCSAAAAVAS